MTPSSTPLYTLPLHAIAHGRAGDKGNVSNISVISYLPDAYGFLEEQLTQERVFSCFSHLNVQQVKRYCLPNLHAMNFVISGVLDGGVNASRSLDRHGKTLSMLMLGRIWLDIPAHYVPKDSPYLNPEHPHYPAISSMLAMR